MADLSGLKSGERTIEILNPANGENVGIRVTLMSLVDERMKKTKRRIADERLKLEQRGKSFKAEELEENWNNLLFNAMTGWEWYNPTGAEGDTGYDKDAMPNYGGKVPEFTRVNVIAILDNLSWFQEQIGEAVNEGKAFFTNSNPI